MKSYLITTGTIFGLIALLHLWRGILELSLLRTNPGHFWGMASLGVLAAVLSVWAWGLLRRGMRT